VVDLIDSWAQSLRRKKKVSRKKVSVNAGDDEAAQKRCVPALADALCFSESERRWSCSSVSGQPCASKRFRECLRRRA
jgi:hypothetical protein